MKKSKSRRKLSGAEAAAYSQLGNSVKGERLRKVLLELQKEGKIDAYWSDAHNEVVWQRNNDG